MNKNLKLKENKTNGEIFESHASYDMIVFCHLRWDFVYQRPQHIISRLSKLYKILVVEEPIHHDEKDSYELEQINSNLSVLKPKVNSIADIKNVFHLLNLTEIDTAWFYSPAFVDLIPYLKINTIIYDCMDELSQFKGASKELKAQEKFLIQEADLVFTGGKSLYEAKSKLSTEVYCFPSSVDVPHFSQSDKLSTIPEDMKSIKHPIIGYVGVIDERIDLKLIEDTAKSLPEVSFVMIGPLAKIGNEDLPQASNIHYLGMKQYKELPGYLKAFDISMMPFALNEATEFISPTKTLEYMAAHKPIISTAIKDVVRDYSDALDIVSNSEEFSKAIMNILTADQKYDSNLYEEILQKTSWDTTVRKMMHLLKKKSQ